LNSGGEGVNLEKKKIELTASEQETEIAIRLSNDAHDYSSEELDEYYSSNKIIQLMRAIENDFFAAKLA